MTGHVAKPLMDAVGPDMYAKVAEWLRDVAAEHAVEADGKVIGPSVSWLAEAVTFYP